MRRLSLRLLMLVVAVLPAGARQRAVTGLAYLRYRRYYGGIRPQAVNIRQRLGCSPEQAEAVLRRAFELHLLGILDGLRTARQGRRGLATLVEFRGLDRLEAAQRAGGGVVVSTAHGEGLLTALAALAERGHAVNIIRVSSEVCHRNRLSLAVAERMNRRLERCGCRFLWMDSGRFGTGVQALNALHRNEMVVSPIDLSQSRDNAIVHFLGGPAAFPRGLSLLARASGAPMVDLFVYRDRRGRLIAEFGEPCTVSDVHAGVQHSASRLEAQIRRHPADWSPWHVFDLWVGLEFGAPAASPEADPARETAGAIG